MANGRTILYVEDESTDVFFVKWAFHEARLDHRICHVNDGQEAIEYLSGTHPYDDRAEHPLPDLVLLDIKMPRLNGFDVLSWVRDHPGAIDCPFVVFSSSSHEGDQERARMLGAAEYRVKPHQVKDLIQLARALHERYLAGQG